MNSRGFKREGENGMLYYVFRDIDDDLICLVRAEDKVPYVDIRDCVYEVRDVQPPKDVVVFQDSSEWTIAMWYTWAAFELCPVIEITERAKFCWHKWQWARIKP